MKTAGIILLAMMLLGTSVVGAVSPMMQSMTDTEPTTRATHTVLGEYATATWCGYCKYAHGALMNLYAGGWRDMYYISLVDDKNTHADARISQLGVTGFPTVAWDGKYDVDVGAGSVPGAQSTYNASITRCGNRAVPAVDLVLSVTWYGNAQMDVTATVYNNESSSYSAQLRVFVCELISSFGWKDTAGHEYTFPFLDYAFNEPITVSAGSTWTSTYYWDGSAHNNGYGVNFGSVEKDNTMLIGGLYNDNNGYVDDTCGYRVGSNRPPTIPSNPNPSHGSTDVPLDQNLGWTSEDPDWFDTVTFDVYFEAGDPTPDVLIADNIKTTSFDPGTLAFTTTYYWQIVAMDENGAISTGPIWSFTTRGNTAPYVPNTPDPDDGETGVYINADLDWIGGDPENDPVTYDVYFGTSSPPPMVAANVSSSSHNLNNLEFDTQYYWRVVSWDSFGERTGGPEWSFTTESNVAPYTPSDPTPTDGATEVNVETDLEWVGGDPNPGDKCTYDVYFGTENPPPLVSQNQTFDQYNPGTMELETTYYWKIVSWDTLDEKATGPIWSFTTALAPNVAPDDPSITGATQIKVNKEYDYVLETEDGNGDEIYYYVSWGDGTSSDWVGPYSSGDPITLSHAWENKGDFSVMVKAKDIYDLESGWTTLEISVPQTHNIQQGFTIGLFPQKINGMLRFWFGDWNEIDLASFDGYCGKFILFGTVQ